MNRQILSLLSLCQRAGKMKTGEDTVEKAIQKKEAKLVIIPEDASDNTKKKFTNKCKHYDVPLLITSTKDILSSIIGKDNRSTFAIIDENFANKIHSMLEQ